MTKHIQFPESILLGLARFGGILAALRGLIIVMDLINRRQFERKLNKFLQKEKPKAEGLQESSSYPVSTSCDKDIYRRKIVSIQDEDIDVSDSLLNQSNSLSPQRLPRS
jgi:hypothetical protein